MLAKEAAEALSQAGYSTRLRPLEKADPAEYTGDSVLGFAVPVAEQGTYPFIWDFWEGLPPGDGRPVFLLDTLMLYSGGIIGPAGRIFRRKGYRLWGAREFMMPVNLMKKRQRPEKEAARREKGERAVRSFIGDLTAGRGRWRDIPGYSHLMSLPSRSQKTFAWLGKRLPFHLDRDACTGCGTCSRLCPAGSLEPGECGCPVHTPESCLVCLRCMGFCPAGAIRFGGKRNLPYQGVTLAALFKALDD